MPESIGNPRKIHPLPLSRRNILVPKELGGASGYRGKDFAKARLDTLRLARGRSTNTGLSGKEVQLEVDHINPYRMGGLTPGTNRQTNLRVTDVTNNRASDFAEGFQEKPRKRKLKY